MTFLFRCPICQAERVASERLIGKRVRCADCHRFVLIAAPGSSADGEWQEGFQVEPQGLASEHVASEPAGHGDGDTSMTDDDSNLSGEFNLEPPSQPAESGEQPVADEGAGGTSDPAPERAAREVISRWKEEPDDTDPDREEVSFGTGRDRSPIEMDMTPMVDVTFLLLIFFMVTASFTLLKTIEQPPPSSEEPSVNFTEIEDNPDYVLVFIDEFNTYMVIYGSYEEEAPSEQELYVRLREAINLDPAQHPTKLLIKAHGDCSHERVVAAMDAGTDVGLTEVDVAMTEQDAL